MLNKKLLVVLMTLSVLLSTVACGTESTYLEDNIATNEEIATEATAEEQFETEPVAFNTEEYTGKWKSLDNPGVYLELFEDGTGQVVKEEQVSFSFMVNETGLQTDLDGEAELIRNDLHGIKHLSNTELGEFYKEDDASNADESVEVTITQENWQDYFEIHKDRFGENSYETGKLCYLCEIFYVTVKDEYADRLNVYRDFSVNFDFSFHHIECFAEVDDVAHTYEESALRNDYKIENGSSVFNNESYARIKNLEYVWSDGFAHANLRDDYVFEHWYKYTRDIWYYDTVHDIGLSGVSGSIFLFE